MCIGSQLCSLLSVFISIDNEVAQTGTFSSFSLECLLFVFPFSFFFSLASTATICSRDVYISCQQHTHFSFLLVRYTFYLAFKMYLVFLLFFAFLVLFCFVLFFSVPFGWRKTFNLFYLKIEPKVLYVLLRNKIVVAVVGKNYFGTTFPDHRNFGPEHSAHKMFIPVFDFNSLKCKYAMRRRGRRWVKRGENEICSPELFAASTMPSAPSTRRSQTIFKCLTKYYNCTRNIAGGGVFCTDKICAQINWRRYTRYDFVLQNQLTH